MKIKKIICIVIGIIGFLSTFFECTPRIVIDEAIKKDYTEILTLYPAFMTEHLPDIEVGSVRRIKLEFPKGKYPNGIHLIIKHSEEEIIPIKEYANKNAVQLHHFTDSCLMAVEYAPELYKNASIKIQMCDTVIKDILPVSNFDFFINSRFSPSLDENATIYVLGAEPGKFLDDAYLSRNGVGLSQEWKHGYTKGIAINGNEVIYWLEVW